MLSIFDNPWTSQVARGGITRGHLLRGDGGMHQVHQAGLPQLTSDRQPLSRAIGRGLGEQQGGAGAGGGPLGQALQLDAADGALQFAEAEGGAVEAGPQAIALVQPRGAGECSRPTTASGFCRGL